MNRTKICNIISEMLDNPDKIGIYDTTKAYDKLEALIIPDESKKFYGEWVVYKNWQYWCIGCSENGKLILIPKVLSNLIMSNKEQLILIDSSCVSLWKEPQTATLSNGKVVTLTDEEYNTLKERG